MDIRPTIFEFTSYNFEPAKTHRVPRIFFNYKVSFSPKNIVLFTETIILPKAPNLKNIPPKLYKKVLQDLHLALGISYYKLYCSKKIKINYSLSKEEADFWNSFYTNGLGEFFYRNKLSSAIFPGFAFDKNKKTKNYRLEKNAKFLVGVGGGKDSIVSAELLKKYGTDFSSFYIETQKTPPLVDNIIEKIGKKSFKIKRRLDEKLFNGETGYYSGHIPISGIYAFLGILSAIFYQFSYFVVANEFSSNFGNVRYKGKIINHQWSKSSEFENLFQNYVKEFISPDLLYFSLIRPFYEIRIAEMFVKLKKYLFSFSSCNNNFKVNRPEEEFSENKLWCGHCPKCVFVFLILSPFLSKEELISIFGRNLFQNVEILATLRDILGFGRSKPFDCVGTYSEARAAFYLSREKFRDDLAGEVFLPRIDPDDNRYLFDYKKMPIKIYFQGKKKPRELIEEVFKTKPSSVPDYLKFLGADSAMILGFGKEGGVVKEYLEKIFPDLKIGVGDIKTDDNYLEKQTSYDIAVRSPGVAKENLKIPYTTATNIFFSYVRQIPGIKIIGVTGTKGKSTTASLIYHILKKAGRKAKLLGNIGTPMLSALMDKINKNTIFVLELSSYQLDDIKFSPDVAVVTSLFPEHMDYHLNIKSYYGAKKNIIKYQQADDIFVFNPKDKKMTSWVKDGPGGTPAKASPFVSEKILEGVKLPLIGEHNKENIRAAITAVKYFDLSDDIIKKAVESFKPLPHRLEFAGEFKGIKFYDDAISTTPESTIMALKSLPKVGTILLGGQDRGYKFSKLEKMIKKCDIKNIVLFPDSGDQILKSKKGLNILETKSMEEAIKFSYKYTPRDEICLLSCASPSYSVWKDFEEKGDQFKFWVKYFSKNLQTHKDEKTL